MKKLVLGFLLILLTLVSCNANKIDFDEFFSFDTYINVALYNDYDAKKHLSDIKDIFVNTSRYASDYEGYNNSSIYDLNQNRMIKSNDVVLDMLNKSIELQNKTNGYFNPFIGRLSRIWKNSIKQNVLPDDELIKEEINIMNNTSVKVEDNYIKLVGDGDVDLGAFAKGYVCGLVYDYLAQNNIKEYLINAGESMVLIGDKKISVGFKVPKSKNTYFAKAMLNDISIASSSSEYQYFMLGGKEYHHIISPFTGYPVNNYDMVSVFTNDIYSADTYSTAIYLMNIEEAKKFASSNNIDIVLFKEKIIYKSSGCDYIEEI